MSRITASATAALRSLTFIAAYRTHPLRTLLAAAAVALSVYVLAMPASPTASLGRWNTDHFSHYSAAILAWHRGPQVFSTPATKLCSPTSKGSLAASSSADEDFEAACNLPERAGKRPLVLNWASEPRPYPPGALLFAAPEALLYAHTELSFQTINRLTIVKDIVVGHVLVGVLLAMLLGGTDEANRRRWRSVAVVIVPLVYFSIVPFAMTGFYDSISILCVCCAISRLDRTKPVAAIGFLSLAAFLHFRAIWYLPLGFVALLQLRRERTELATRRSIAVLVGSAVLLGLSAYSLLLVAPSLQEFPHTNPVLLSQLGRLDPAHINFILLAVITLGTLAWQRQYTLLVLAGWVLLVISLSVQAQGWHGMFLVPLFAVAHWQRARPATIAVIVLLVVGLNRVAYFEAAMPGSFFYLLVHGIL